MEVPDGTGPRVATECKISGLLLKYGYPYRLSVKVFGKPILGNKGGQVDEDLAAFYRSPYMVFSCGMARSSFSVFSDDYGSFLRYGDARSK